MNNYLWEYMVVVFIIIGLYFMISFKILWNSRQKEKKFLRTAEDDWGKIPERNYTHQEFEAITHYFINSNKDGFFIDDITWNDLGMDQVFQNINATHSSAGQEYLYDMLRRPVFYESVLKERNNLIEYFSKEKEQRKILQLNCAKLGRMKQISITDYLENLLELKRTSNLSYYISNLFIIIGLLSLFIRPQTGIILFIASLAYGGYLHYTKKQHIAPYITSFEYIIKLIDSATALGKESKLETKELTPYLNKLLEAQKHLRKFRKNSFLLTSGNNLSGGGPETLILDYIRIFMNIDLIKFNQMLKEVRKNLSWIYVMLESIGLLDSMVAVASYRESLNYYSIPELIKNENLYIKAMELYHPLIEEPINNDISVSRGVLITGSNASGKSTFLKTVAINQILAQTIVTTTASSFKSNYFKVYTSMALQDNLKNKESYFMVEIKSLKRIIDTTKEFPVLCFVDEVLRGTNTVERIAASSQILKSFAKNSKTICFAATHDIELTYLLEDYFDNYHFEEKIEENDILFDYHLLSGKATSRNAIQLLSIIGYDNKIISDAEATAGNFLKSGEWKLTTTKRMEA